MESRTYIGCQVYKIAEAYNISQVSVRTIVDNYIVYSRGRLASGGRVNFFGLAYITPEFEYLRLNITLAYECKLVADKIGFPQYTVYVIVKAYIDDLIESVLTGRTAEIRGIMSVHPLMQDGYFCKIHSSVSQALKSYIRDSNAVCGNIRVHTYKSLKDKIAERKFAYDRKDA